MKPGILRAGSQRPNTITIYRPIEDYWNSYGPGEDRGRASEQALDPFTATLIHLVLNLVPGLPMLVDLAAGATGGASSLIGLTHPHVRHVVAVSDGKSVETERALSALREYLRSHASGMASFDVLPPEEMPGHLSNQSRVVIVVDTRRGDIWELEQGIPQWLEVLPDVLVLLIGVGRVGECAITGSLLGLCEADSGRQFWLLRDFGEVLAASHLGMVARADHPWARKIILRLQQLYTGNFEFLDLLRSVNLSALEAAQVDAEAIKNSPLSWALMNELRELKRLAHESSSQAAAAAGALASANAELNDLRRALQEARARQGSPTLAPVTVSLSFLMRVRRRLAPTVLGKVWRLSRRFSMRVRRKLAPTVVGKVWRLSKRVVRRSVAQSR